MKINQKIPSLPRTKTTGIRPYLWLVSMLLLLIAANARADTDKIVIVGDSLSAAYGIAIEKGWVAGLQQRINGTRYNVDVVNASVSGDTTANGLSRLPALLATHKPAFVLIELGGNDGLRGLSIKKMAQNLTDMATLASDSGAQVIIVGMQIPSNYGKGYTTLFRNTFAKVAEQTESALVPFLLRGLESGLQWFQSDGVHPNEDAQSIMLDNVWQVLEPLFEARY